MDFYSPNYSLAVLCLVAVICFLAGRWSKSDEPKRQSRPIGEARSGRPQGKHRAKSSELSAEAEREIQDLLQRGRLIAAVRVARRDLGIGLKDAKQIIDALRKSSLSP